MKVAIYARSLQKPGAAIINQFFELLDHHNFQYILHSDFQAELKRHYNFQLNDVDTFIRDDNLATRHIDILISLGGDGTLLDTLSLVKGSQIPVMGINAGRLGFLANIPSKEIDTALSALKAGNYTTQPRSLISLETDDQVLSTNPYALNDFVVHKRDFSSMVTVETYLSGEYFNTYWADGLIVATPTGSTGYSLSCGGPIIFPETGSFVITPVAPHNLNIRPIVISDQQSVKLRITGRDKDFLASLDSRYTIMPKEHQLVVSKAPFYFNLVKLHHQSFIQTIRDKLKWGADSRNE